jgi:hypothetical protein
VGRSDYTSSARGPIYSNDCREILQHQKMA